MKATLPDLVMKADTVGVFVPSTDENAVHRCLDREHASSVSELAASLSQYPLAGFRVTSTVSNLGLSSLAVSIMSVKEVVFLPWFVGLFV